ncbi:hypothetical protein MH117_22070 [Paenibacillus sp. ACRRX]|uniref:hypothetical protein n=1 Tax=Paenibacillus sp. ACRRX TaxID=2918206 RepID=UPI001EF460DF|nr:hypothetical protein [Paenibacillus sp. ACRRX]MCG7410104.1 hypothetical protein [Paenibacillus sp. ACRRX]
MQVPGSLYSNLFLTPPSTDGIMVESLVWNVIIERVPDHYVIPDLQVAAPFLDSQSLPNQR